MAEEGLAVLEADVRVDELTVLEQADDLLRPARVPERPREQIAEAGGHRQERHGPARGGHRDGALGRVATHRDQEREASRVRRRPALQALETGKDVEPDLPALGGERLAETSSQARAPPFPDPGVATIWIGRDRLGRLARAVENRPWRQPPSDHRCSQLRRR